MSERNFNWIVLAERFNLLDSEGFPAADHHVEKVVVAATAEEAMQQAGLVGRCRAFRYDDWLAVSRQVEAKTTTTYVVK